MHYRTVAGKDADDLVTKLALEAKRGEWRVIGLVKDLAPDTFLVGFKLEVGKTPEELRQIAFQFLKKNRCDLVVANDLRQIEGGEHTGYFITPDGRVAKTVVGKDAIARTLIDYLDAHLE